MAEIIEYNIDFTDESAETISMEISLDTMVYHNEFVNAPAHYNSLGTAGQMAYDDDYFYVCVATNRWMKTPGIKNF